MRALMTATVPSMIGQFNMKNIELLLNLGYEVDVACNFNNHSVWSEEKIIQFKNKLSMMNVNLYHIDFERSINKIFKHIKSYKEIKFLMNNRQYNIIHTHTPISSFITRIAFKKSNIYNHCKMIYTAHGFHFFKGNTLIKNFIFKSLEKTAAKYTDILITINREDYQAGKKFKLRKDGIVEYIPGVGIDLDIIEKVIGDKKSLCNELNIPIDSILLLSVGELNKNKNHKIVLSCLSELPNNVHYLICGAGPLKQQYENSAKIMGIEKRLHLLGYREDIIKIMKSCDLFIFPSKREGLSVSLLEASACGLPCIASNIRGNVDIIQALNNGVLFTDKNKLRSSIISLINGKKKINKIYSENITLFSLSNIMDKYYRLYTIGDSHES